MTKDIIAKLRAELESGITSEAQVVYLMVGIRKIIERDEIDDNYSALKFHCDWALHPKMSRRAAREMLKLFDDAHVDLVDQVKLESLPIAVRRGIDRIAKMTDFEAELKEFLAKYELPQLSAEQRDGWLRFVRLYSKVVEDIPLFASDAVRQRAAVPALEPIKNIASVTVHLDDAKETVKEAGFEDFLYRIRWVIEGKDGKFGEISIYNSFAVSEPQIE